MRKGLSVFVLLPILVAGVAQAVDLCAYQPPRTSITSLWLSGTYRYFDSAATPEVDVNAGRLTLTLTRFFDTPGFGYSVNALGDLALSGFSVAGFSAQASHTMRLYFSPDEPFFGFGGVDVGYAFGQPTAGLRISAGLGYGRFRDVTPMAQAVRINRLLLERKLLSQSLPDDVLLAIAQEIGRKEAYAEEKEWVAAVIKLIEGAANVQLDARTVLLVEEEILHPVVARSCGWAVEAGLTYEVLDPFGGPRDFGLTISANFAYAVSPESQILFHAVATGPFNIINEHTINASLSYEQIFSPTSSLRGNIGFIRVKPSEADPQDTITATVQLSFVLAGANVGVSASLTRGPGDPGWSVDLSLTFSLRIL